MTKAVCFWGSRVEGAMVRKKKKKKTEEKGGLLLNEKRNESFLLGLTICLASTSASWHHLDEFKGGDLNSVAAFVSSVHLCMCVHIYNAIVFHWTESSPFAEESKLFLLLALHSTPIGLWNHQV